MVKKLTLQEKLAEHDFRYCVDYDYDEGFHNHYECEEEGICRCSTIENLRIEDYSIASLSEELLKIYNWDYKNIKKQPIFVYALERYLRIIVKKYGADEIFQAHVYDGYYGEEVKNVNIEDTTIIAGLAHLPTLNSDQLIEFVLIEEYGYLLPKLQNSVYTIETVLLKDIVIPNDSYVRKLDKDIIESYKNYDGIVAILDGDNHVIDGYHRIIAAQQGEKKKVKVIVARKES